MEAHLPGPLGATEVHLRPDLGLSLIFTDEENEAQKRERTSSGHTDDCMSGDLTNSISNNNIIQVE